jgi:acetolactate synthase I/II/III large subunit
MAVPGAVFPDRTEPAPASERGVQPVKGSDLLVAALENEDVERIFGLPGEENLDFVESLRRSKIRLVPMVMITGQKGILSRKQARFQVVDVVATMTP